MPDREYFEAEDFATREPLIEQFAQLYVQAHPDMDIVIARQITDAHPQMQALLGRYSDHDNITHDDAPGATLVAAPPVVEQVGAYAWEGEVKELTPARGYDLLARYRQAAKALHNAKEEAKAVEAEIMEELGGYEHGAVDGQQLFHWPIVDSTSFDRKSFCEDPEREALYKSYLKTKKTRRFKVDGTVGVD